MDVQWSSVNEYIAKDTLEEYWAYGRNPAIGSAERLYHKRHPADGPVAPGSRTWRRTQIDPGFHLLSRAAYGPCPSDLDRGDPGRGEMSKTTAPDSIDDSAATGERRVEPSGIIRTATNTKPVT